MPKQTVSKIKFNRIFLVPIFIVLLGAGIFYFKKLSSTTKIMDNFPIMVINDGQNAVYQEVKVAKDKIEKEIVVSNLKGEDQKEVKIYEYIPKEVAEKVSELEFSVQPQIIENDPIVLWQVEPSGPKPVQINYTVKKRMEETQCLHPKYINEMQNVYKLDPFDFNDCSKYLHIKFLDAVYKNQKRREQEEKDKVQLIQPGEEQYKDIQKKAKETIKATKTKSTPSKISAKEAIAIVKKNSQYSVRYNTQPNLECKATFSNEDQGWRVICSGRNLIVNKSYLQEFYYEFYLVAKDGKTWKEKAVYEKTKDTITGQSFPVSGEPMWGVQ